MQFQWNAGNIFQHSSLKRSNTQGQNQVCYNQTPILLHRFETTGGNWLLGARLQLLQLPVLPGSSREHIHVIIAICGISQSHISSFAEKEFSIKA